MTRLSHYYNTIRLSHNPDRQIHLKRWVFRTAYPCTYRSPRNKGTVICNVTLIVIGNAFKQIFIYNNICRKLCVNLRITCVNVLRKPIKLACGAYKIITVAILRRLCYGYCRTVIALCLSRNIFWNFRKSIFCRFKRLNRNNGGRKAEKASKLKSEHLKSYITTCFSSYFFISFYIYIFIFFWTIPTSSERVRTIIAIVTHPAVTIPALVKA